MDVLITGAGPTGLTLACDLLRRGVDVCVVDRAQAPSEASGSRGKGIQPRSQELFHDLGVLPGLQALATPYPRLRAYAAGEVVWEGEMQSEGEPGPDAPYANALLLPQWQTERILRARFAELGGTVRQAELLDFTDDGAGVTAELSDVDGVQRVRARYLIGADGGRSAVRKRLGVGFAGETTETERMLIGDVRVDGLDRNYWHLWGHDAASTVGLCPLSGTELYQFSAPLLGEVEVECSPEGMRRVFAERAGDVGVHLGEVAWVSLYRTNVRMVDRYRVGNVFLAGDAAHVHSPAGGQGMNTGVQDAYNLGWKLAAALAGAPDALLDSYEQERLPIAAEVLGISTRYHRAATTQSQGDGPKRGDDTKQLGIHYRGGPLAFGDAAGPVRAGDRAPDAPCVLADGSATTLFEVFRGPQATLLVFGGAPVPDGLGSVRPVVVRAAGESAEAGDVVDEHGFVAAAYGSVADPRLLLVRPDGYVAAVGADDTAVREYLRATAPVTVGA